MTTYNSAKKMFGGYKIVNDDLFNSGTKFKGDYFELIPEEKGIRVVGKKDGFSKVYKNVRHMKGLNFFVCDFEEFVNTGIYDKRSYVDDEIYHLKTVCDTLTGKTIFARRIQQDYIVDEYNNIYFVQNGTIAREPFEENAQACDGRDYASHDGAYLVTRDSHSNINVVTNQGEYVLKNIAEGRDTTVYIYGDKFPGNETTCYVQNSKRMAIVSEKGVIYETEHQPLKTLSTGIVGDMFYINEHSPDKEKTSKMMIFDSNNKKLHEFEISRSLWEVKEVDGEMVFVFVEGPYRNKKITEIKLSEYIALQNAEKSPIGEGGSKTQPESGSNPSKGDNKPAPTQMGE